MSELILDSLQIQGFRAFRDLTIPKLGRINLIVGKNNVGKTCVLEALRLFADRGALETAEELIEARQETGDFDDSATTSLASPEWINQYGNLFNGRPAVFGIHGPTVFQVGPSHRQNEILKISVGVDASGSGVPSIILELDGDTRAYPLSSYIYRFHALGIFRSPLKSVFVPVGGVQTKQVVSLWEKVSLTDAESDILSALHLIAPEVVRVNLFGTVPSNKNQSAVVKVRLANSDKPVALGSLGEGMNRLFGLALGLVNATDGFLLIDEVETGLHYTVQQDMWRLIFETAKKLNVQVFATTHSYDCVRAFEQVALKHDEEGIVVRLYRDKNGDVKSSLYDEADLAVVAEQNIEVR